MVEASWGKTHETEELRLGPDVRLDQPKPEVLTLDLVLPGDLPKPVDDEIRSHIYQITCIDYYLDHDRHSRVMRYFRSLEEMCAESDVSIFQMQENVDPTQVPSATATVGLMVQQLQQFTAENLARLQMTAMIIDYTSSHARADRENLFASDWLQAAENEYRKGVMKYRRLSEHFKSRYGTDACTLEQLESLDPAVVTYLRQTIPSVLQRNDDGDWTEDAKKREFLRWRERMIMEITGQAEADYDRLRHYAWQADLKVKRVHEQAKGYRKTGSQGLRRSFREQQRLEAKRETSVQVVNR